MFRQAQPAGAVLAPGSGAPGFAVCLSLSAAACRAGVLTCTGSCIGAACGSLIFCRARLRRVEPAVQELQQGIVNFAVAGLGQLPTATEPLRIVQVLGRGQQVRMLPDGVPALDAAFLLEGSPQGRRFPQPAGTQLQSHKGGERVLGRTSRGPAPPDGLTERGSGGKDFLSGGGREL